MNAYKALMIGIAGMGITGMGLFAVAGYHQSVIMQQQRIISGLEERLESTEMFALRHEINSGSPEYVILGDEINADALTALRDDYENRMSQAFSSLTERTGIKRQALTAASVHDSNGPVTGTSVKGPVNLFFRTWEELGGAGKSPVTPPNLEQVAGAAYGGKLYVTDLGINIARNVSPVIRLNGTMKLDISQFGTVYIAPQK